MCRGSESWLAHSPPTSPDEFRVPWLPDTLSSIPFPVLPRDHYSLRCKHGKGRDWVSTPRGDSGQATATATCTLVHLVGDLVGTASCPSQSRYPMHPDAETATYLEGTCPTVGWANGSMERGQAHVNFSTLGHRRACMSAW